MKESWFSFEFVLAASLLLGAPLRALGTQDPSVILGRPVWTNNQVQFTLTGESGVTYVIESSADLQTWASAATNSASSITRVITVNAPDAARFYRAVRDRLPIFAAAIAASGNVDLKGNNLATDSFDSSDPNYSINGLYPYGHLEKTKANGDVCARTGLIDSLSVGNANIKGSVRTGSGTNTIAIGAHGSVGDRYWVEGGNLGIQPGHATTDYNVVFPDVVLPNTVWLPPISGNYNIDGTDYQYVFLTPGNWDFYLPANRPFRGNVYVGTNVNLRLWIDFTISTNRVVFRLSPVNAILQIFTDHSFSLTGPAYIDNQSGHAERFCLFGLPGCTNITFGGNSGIFGCVYAPQAVLYLGGGGNDTIDFIGATVTKKLTFNGHFDFHFDENLLRIGPTR